jgi:hypothetical protein
MKTVPFGPPPACPTSQPMSLSDPTAPLPQSHLLHRIICRLNSPALQGWLSQLPSGITIKSAKPLPMTLTFAKRRRGFAGNRSIARC